MIFEKLKKIIAEQFSADEEELTPETRFEDLGADSLDLVELVMAIEEEFDIQVDDEDVDSMSTIGDAVEYIKERV
ncbi:MAG: acyl carrier protein [Bacillota bacterium]|nr:acyl carrier protein [Bacillota bacterium]